MTANKIVVAIALLLSGATATLAKSAHNTGHNREGTLLSPVKRSGSEGADRWGWQGPPPWPSLNHDWSLIARKVATAMVQEDW